MYILSNRYEACNGNQTIDFVAKSKDHKQKAFQTDDTEISYNCAKSYHV